MNPQLLQSIQLMALPIQELKFKIQEELERNPALEMVEDKSEDSLDSSVERTTEDYDFFENSSDPGRPFDPEASDRKRSFMEGALSRPESLHDHLMWQLRLQPIGEREFGLGELLIQNLDDDGFHIEAPESLVPRDDRVALPPIISLIQNLDPVGTCTADYTESLMVQARIVADAPDHTLVVIEHHLEMLEKGKLEEIARKLKIHPAQVSSILEYIRTLDPFPGRRYSIDTPTYVIPDLQVRIKEGEFVLVLNDEEIPVLGINPFFTDLMDAKNGSAKTGSDREKNDKKTKTFVRSSLKDAKWFIRSIHQRNQTLVKIAKAIVEFQRDFFAKGPKSLVPLTLKDIAEEVDVHETTVSRITTAKYIQTEWGIYELKYFFSNSISGAGSRGSRFSKEGVKQVIKELLENDASKKHLSDQKISDMLKMQGISIARRTVAKYRNELDIDSSYTR
jgi:RNA polymerase sigma-54 factor